VLGQLNRSGTVFVPMLLHRLMWLLPRVLLLRRMGMARIVVAILPGPILFSVYIDIRFARRNAASIYARYLKAGSHLQGGHAFRQQAQGNAGVKQGPQKHVAAYT
jgi:hypothetical protein